MTRTETYINRNIKVNKTDYNNNYNEEKKKFLNTFIILNMRRKYYEQKNREELVLALKLSFKTRH